MPQIARCCVACKEPDLERQPAVLMPFVALRALGWEACVITPDWQLRSVPLGSALPLCMSLHCPRCGLLFLDLRFDDSELKRLYEDYRGPRYTAQREGFEPGYALRNAGFAAGHPHQGKVEALLSPWTVPQPRILDWGGDTGLNTPLRSRAAIHHVLDISGKPLVKGAQHVEHAMCQAYDLVVLSNVLEHVPDPLGMLERVAAALAPGGRLYIEVPFEAVMMVCEADAASWRSKRHWHEHVNFFSPAALQEVTRRAGLQVLDCQRIALPDGSGAVQLGLVCERA